MKVVQVVPSVGEESSGPSYSVPGLCNGLLATGCEVSLHFGGNLPARSFPYPVTCSPFSRFPHPRLGRSPKMERALLEAVRSVDIVQNNSFWMYPNVYAYRALRNLKKNPGARLPKLVNAPRGTLASWALNHHKLQKRLFGFLAGQYAAMKATDMWHAPCKNEYEEIRAAGFTQPVAIVPIGMDIPNVEYAQATGSPKSGHRVAFFGRIHKVKNIDMLVKAWHVISGGECDKGLDDWELVIAGPDGGVRGDLEAYIADHRIPRVRFVGEINGPAKYEFLSQADLYVLPSKTENFGIALDKLKIVF